MADFSAFSAAPAIGAMVAAAVTSAFASLKFYSDKAAKVTDFRQSWITSLRNDVAQFSGSIHTIAGRIAIRSRHGDDATSNDGKSQAITLKSFSDIFSRIEAPAKAKFDKAFETELLTHWSTLRLSYNKIVLHLNPVEHLAYIRAEEAIAAFTKCKDENTTTRREVEKFLWECIRLAENTSTTPAIKSHKHDALDNIYRNATGVERGHSRVTPLTTKDTGIDNLSAGAGAGSSLLLAAFATRQLLHGSYADVLRNIPIIEHGIRVIDTSAAIVIKNIWEDIKHGEPTYRRISLTALFGAVVLVAALAASIYFSPDKQEKKMITTCDWVGPPGASPGSAPPLGKPKLICNTISPP